MTRHAFSQKMATKTLQGMTSLFLSKSAVVSMHCEHIFGIDPDFLVSDLFF